MSEELLKAATEQLHDIPGVEGIFVDGGEVYVVALEHDSVDRDALLDVEDRLEKQLGQDVIIHVRAHQGRGVDSVKPYPKAYHVDPFGWPTDPEAYT